MIEAVFRDFILAHPAFAAVKVFQDRIPQSEDAPVMSIRKLDSDSTYDHGYLPGHAETRYRVTAYAETFAGLVALREGLRGLDGWNLAEALASGRGTSFNDPGTELQAVLIVFESDQFEEASQLRQLVVDFQIMHTQTFVPLP